MIGWQLFEKWRRIFYLVICFLNRHHHQRYDHNVHEKNELKGGFPQRIYLFLLRYVWDYFAVL